MQRWQDGNVQHTLTDSPEGYVVADTYRPCSSVTPWDYYGGKHQQEYITVLRAAGIPCAGAQRIDKILHPRGTGRGGAVRFGDNMLPGEYYILVPPERLEDAQRAFEAHRE